MKVSLILVINNRHFVRAHVTVDSHSVFLIFDTTSVDCDVINRSFLVSRQVFDRRY